MRNGLHAHARASFPEECCGALIGWSDGAPVAVESVAPLANVAADATSRYEIDPRHLLDLHFHQRDAVGEVVGYYHSHPRGAAVPSEVDRRAAWPGVSYLICSVDDRGRCRTRSWRLVDDHFREEALLTGSFEVASQGPGP